MLSIQQILTAARTNASMLFDRGCGNTNRASLLLLVITMLGTPEVFSAELFPFSPPKSQQRDLDQPFQAKPQLSKEDILRATRLAEQAKQLAPEEQRQFRENIQRKLKEAVREGNIAQAQYYTELLAQFR